MRRLALALLLLAVASSARAGCPPPPAGQAVVMAVGEDGTLRLADGRIVVIAGLALEPAAIADLAAESQGETVTLRPLKPAEDRWGRLIAEVDLGPAHDSESLAVAMLELGLGHAAAIGRDACLAPLFAAEAAARAAKLGVWRKAGYVLSADDVGALVHHLGEHVVVEGRVVSARALRSRVYVNFAHRRDRGLSVVVRKRDWSRNGVGQAAGRDALRGRRLRVRGHLEWHGGPLIDLTGEEPMERLD
jgi:hypothetical protein